MLWKLINLLKNPTYDPGHDDCKCSICYRDHMNVFKAKLSKRPAGMAFALWDAQVDGYTYGSKNDVRNS